MWLLLVVRQRGTSIEAAWDSLAVTGIGYGCDEHSAAQAYVIAQGYNRATRVALVKLLAAATIKLAAIILKGARLIA
jgi:hypothetical protein